MSVVFVDTETTGLDPERHEIWEIALIDGIDEWEFQLPVDLATADPMGLRVGRFYERRRKIWTLGDLSRISRVRYPKDEKWTEVLPRNAAENVACLLDGKHMVGAVPSFDAAFLTKWLNANGHAATWHYHLIDVEALAVGHLFGSEYEAARQHEAHALDPPCRRAWMPDLPWDSEQLSAALNIDPKQFDRHTALGDARWAKAIYESVVAK